MRTTPQDTVRCRFFAPVEQAKTHVASRRKCPEFSDDDYLESGIGRVIADVRSGRDWVQRLRMWMNSRLTVSNFFQSLKSPRRLRYLEHIASAVCRQMDRQVTAGQDPLSGHPELSEFAVYASDGHYEQPSAHDVPVDERKQPVGFFYAINLRSHSLSLLDIARPRYKREHDIHMLKRLSTTQLRMGTAVGRKVIHVYDSAAVDYAQWYRWKAQGTYIISREKASSTAVTLCDNLWDRSDPRNTGVISDETVGVFCGLPIRRVRYRDPATEIVFSFITSEMHLPPGLIAFLYKLRWDIEKVFDEKKNKLLEKKAWAQSRIARSQQAQFICLAHNLMVLFERCLEEQEGITDEKSSLKREQRAAQVRAQICARGQIPNPLVEQCTRITQRSLQFIRWLRHCLFYPTPYSDSLTLLRPLMA